MFLFDVIVSIVRVVMNSAWNEYLHHTTSAFIFISWCYSCRWCWWCRMTLLTSFVFTRWCRVDSLVSVCATWWWLTVTTVIVPSSMTLNSLQLKHSYSHHLKLTVPVPSIDDQSSFKIHHVTIYILTISFPWSWVPLPSNPSNLIHHFQRFRRNIHT